MINPETIQQIRDAMCVEEVVGEFVTLRKRGANLIGLCPFHNEKTPSFNVHPVKGIFKCFGCGEGGNPIDFLIKHEQLTYVEALRWLARKYSIEIQEEEMTPEQSATHELRERLFNINAFAEGYFHQQLQADEGRAVGLSYCREREITDESIAKFRIGYSPTHPEAFSDHALAHGYDREILVKSGLCLERENGRLTDRFRGRLIFPIHNLSGRVVGFGGRILTQETNRPKYINSPETEIYLKSKSLYGIYQGRSAIASADNAFLVEGYTDVIAMHQAGVHNVVASSGTSLTEDQIRAIRRYSPNITIIYDGDAAGIKASFRGIDLILKEGMNVRIVPMPEGEDPDSFARRRKSSEVIAYFTEHSENFITFKAGLLKAEAAGDPVKMGTMIRDIIQSVAMIPDPLLRTLFVRESATVTGMEEEQLIYELNRQLRNQRIKTKESPPEELPEPERKRTAQPLDEQSKPLISFQEDDVIRLLVNYGNHVILIPHDGEQAETTTLAHEIVRELDADGITFENPLWQKIYDPFSKAVAANTEIPGEAIFIHHEDAEVRAAVIDMVSSPYSLSQNWGARRIHVPMERDHLLQAIDEAIHSFRMRKVEAMMQQLQARMGEVTEEADAMAQIKKYQRLLKIRAKLAEHLGRTITF
jgi:DNA primase